MSAAARILAMASALLLAGCAGDLLRRDDARETADALAAYDRVAAMGADDQQREFAAAQAAYQRTPNDATRLRLALLLLLPRSPWHDGKRARALLAEIEPAPEGERSSERDLAQLLLALVGEFRQAEHADQRRLEQQAQQLREERRKSEELRQKSEDLRQKIESLRSIDREMRARGQEP